MSEPEWLDIDIVIDIHAEQLALFGGADGVRDRGLIQSALGRPQHKFAYEESDLAALAAAYAFSIAKNHPFVDGNKRTGFVVGVLFPELNGYRFTASEPHAARAVLELAAGSIDENGYLDFLRAHTKRA